MISSFSRTALLTALALGVSVAEANPFAGANGVTGNLTFDGASNGYGTVSLTYAGLVSGSPNSVLTGQFKGSFDPEDGGAAEPDDFFRFFCIDLSQWAYGGTLAYTRTTDGFDADNYWQLTRLYENVYPNPALGNFAPGSSSNFGNFATTEQSAAMQLAIWEIWFDDGLSLSTGALTATGGSVVATAQGYLDGIATGAHSNAPGWQLYRFTNAEKQDYLSATYTPPAHDRVVPLPLPGTLTLLGAGLAGLGVARRKTQR